MKYFLALLLSVSCGTLYAQHGDIPATEKFQVTGAVKTELTLAIKDLLRFHQDTLGDLLIRNKRGEEKEHAAKMKGVLLKDVLDSAHVQAGKPKEYSELCIILTASDGYRNVYSWNEVFNTDIGNHVYVITEKDGKTMDQIPDRILVLSLSDFNSGRRHLKGLAKIEVKKVP